MSSFAYRNNKNSVLLISLVLFVSVAIGVCVSFFPKESLYIIPISLVSFGLLFVFIVKTEKMIKFFSISLLASLFLFPSVSVGGIGLRVDDFIVVLLSLFLVYLLLNNYNSIHTPINKLIFYYIIYVLLITITQILINNLSTIYLLFAIRELQYLIYFFSFVYIMKYEWFRENFKRLFLCLSIITMVWVLYQLAFNANVGFYGTGLISESGSSQSGGVFFIISMFFLYLININYKLKERTLYFLLFIGSAGMLITTMSRTAIMAFGVVYFIYLIFTLFRLSTKRIIITIYATALASPLVYFLVKDEIEGILHRMNAISGGTNTRLLKWEYLLSYVSDLGFVFGEGRGFAQTMTGGLTLGTDSQYVRNVMELGYVGSVLFILLILSILVFAFRHLKTFYGESLFIILITCGFMVMSITHEVFLVTMQASFYWTLIGAFVGKIINDKKVHLEQTAKL